MKYFLFDTFIESIRYGADEHTLCQSRNLACRNKAIHLRIDRSGLVVAVDSDTLPLLQYLSEAFGKVLAVLPTT